MILIKNTQRKYPVDKKAMTRTVQIILDYLGYSDFDIGIQFTNNNTIARYNESYRHKHGPTDILSFPYHQRLKAGNRIIAKNPDQANLGDIIISLEFVHTSDQWKNYDSQEVLDILLVHGICHLLGYDHETDTDYEIMHKKEAELLKILYERSA